ncbi:substrate-binding domain-containing protein [Paraburkholderia sp.]|uniref:substrate-binding domain-containing protein n=1 Tax=Paraburkholderia sp. TaxID=1926495 RepID=UPI00286F698B|nr:substrate-binding domain-containing protein [Paraburkholderia sp.]
MHELTRRRFLIASALAACGAATPLARGAGRDITVALVLKASNDPFTAEMIRAATAFQAHSPYPFKLIVRSTEGETDVAQQAAFVESLAAQSVSAIVLAPVDSRRLVPAVAKCVRQGVLAVTIDNPLDAGALREAGLRVPFVGPDNRRGARLVGDYLARRLHPGERAAIVEGVASDRNAQQRDQGFREAMRAASVKIVATETGDWDYAKGRAAASALLATQPGLRALLCANDNMARGAVDAVNMAHLRGRVLITGYNASAAIKPMLADGRILATVDQFAEKQAVYGIDVVLQALIEQHRQDDLPDVVETPLVLVTKDSAS